MAPAALTTWLDLMAQTRGWSLRRSARELGTTWKSLSEWRERGAKAHIALACAALTHGLMPVEDFAEWVGRKQELLGWSQADCAKQLTCAENSITTWREKGAPRHIALACAAIDFDLEAADATRPERLERGHLIDRSLAQAKQLGWTDVGARKVMQALSDEATLSANPRKDWRWAARAFQAAASVTTE